MDVAHWKGGHHIEECDPELKKKLDAFVIEENLKRLKAKLAIDEEAAARVAAFKKQLRGNQ